MRPDLPAPGKVQALKNSFEQIGGTKPDHARPKATETPQKPVEAPRAPVVPRDEPAAGDRALSPLQATAAAQAVMLDDVSCAPDVKPMMDRVLQSVKVHGHMADFIGRVSAAEVAYATNLRGILQPTIDLLDAGYEIPSSFACIAEGIDVVSTLHKTYAEQLQSLVIPALSNYSNIVAFGSELEKVDIRKPEEFGRLCMRFGDMETERLERVREAMLGHQSIRSMLLLQESNICKERQMDVEYIRPTDEANLAMQEELARNPEFMRMQSSVKGHSPKGLNRVRFNANGPIFLGYAAGPPSSDTEEDEEDDDDEDDEDDLTDEEDDGFDEESLEPLSTDESGELIGDDDGAPRASLLLEDNEEHAADEEEEGGDDDDTSSVIINDGDDEAARAEVVGDGALEDGAADDDDDAAPAQDADVTVIVHDDADAAFDSDPTHGAVLIAAEAAPAPVPQRDMSTQTEEMIPLSLSPRPLPDSSLMRVARHSSANALIQQEPAEAKDDLSLEWLQGLLRNIMSVGLNSEPAAKLIETFGELKQYRDKAAHATREVEMMRRNYSRLYNTFSVGQQGGAAGGAAPDALPVPPTGAVANSPDLSSQTETPPPGQDADTDGADEEEEGLMRRLSTGSISEEISPQKHVALLKRKLKRQRGDIKKLTDEIESHRVQFADLERKLSLSEKDKDKGEAAAGKESAPEGHQVTSGTSLRRVPSITNKSVDFLRVYRTNDSYKTMAYSDITTVEDLLRAVCEKCDMFPAEKYAIYESMPGLPMHVDRLVDNSELVCNLRGVWRLSNANGKDSTHVERRINVKLRRAQANHTPLVDAEASVPKRLQNMRQSFMMNEATAPLGLGGSASPSSSAAGEGGSPKKPFSKKEGLFMLFSGRM